MLKTTTTPDIDALKLLDERLRWLSAWTIHHANHIRDSRRRAEGRRASGELRVDDARSWPRSISMRSAPTTGSRSSRTPGRCCTRSIICSARQSREQLENFRGFGGMQSYPSRTKDRIPVDFSTGSVGLGVAITAFSSLVQDYLTAHGMMDEADRGRFVALIGDAELDEGNIYEALIEGYKHDIRNCWWIVDYNRQSLDATSADRMFERFDEIFASCGWRTVELRYGKRLAAALAKQPATARVARRASQRRLRRFVLSGRRGMAGADRTRPRQDGGGIPQGPRRRGAGRADDRPRRPLHGDRWSRRSTAPTTTSRPCSSPGRSRASACRSPATRTITPG